MVKSYSSPSSDTAAQSPPNTLQAQGPPDEDELAAIVAAVDAYIAIENQLHMQVEKTDKSLSPWLAAGRLQATSTSQQIKQITNTKWRDRKKPGRSQF
jgi:hypothetical protein